MCDCPSPEGFLYCDRGYSAGIRPCQESRRGDTSCVYTALHSNNASDNTNVLIVLHPLGIGIALARHQQLQDTIHILW